LSVYSCQYTAYLSDITILHPEVEARLQQYSEEKAIQSINAKKFRSIKERFILIKQMLLENSNLDENSQSELIETVLSVNDLRDVASTVPLASEKPDGAWFRLIPDSLKGAFAWKDEPSRKVRDVRTAAEAYPDDRFIRDLPTFVDRHPGLAAAAASAVEVAYDYLRPVLKRQTEAAVPQVRLIQQNGIIKQIVRECRSRKEATVHNGMIEFFESVKDKFTLTNGG
jgi:hypothetical protein